MRILFPAFLAVFAAFSGTTAFGDIADEIDPKIGTEGGGNTVIGPCVPFGMAKPGPDTGGNDQNSGWSQNGDINGFSQTHVSGTGGGCKYGNILVMPVTGAVDIKHVASPRANETAKAGFYSVDLTRYGVKTEITTTARAAFYRFTFPRTQEAHLFFDASHCLASGGEEAQHVTASSVSVVSATEVCGSESVKGGWNLQSEPYTVYFDAVLDVAATSPNAPPEASSGSVVLDYDATLQPVVNMKIGLSFVSVEQARANAQREAGFDFEAIRASAVAAWNQALAPVQVKGGTVEQRRLFYTSLYHVMLMPVERTGENPLWTSDAPSYDDFYTLWDTFRSSSPMLTLIAPSRQVEIIKSLLDIEQHEGFLPDGRSGNFNGRTQGGSNADTLMADAYVKQLPGIDWNAAYEAVVKDAEVSPKDQVKEGRGGLEDWKTLGYCSVEGVDRSGNKTMEYAYNDFSVATLAQGLGHTDDAAKYFKRAGQWSNLWNPDFTADGFTGFIQPRHHDGAWLRPFTALEGCSWGGNTFYEGNSWTYSFFVPQDVAGLIAKCGGTDTFVSRLDALFAVPGRVDVTDEPFFLTPYLYIWAGRHDKTAERVQHIITHDYSAAPGGLPGNDDSGAMGSWYAFGAMGIFPNAGQDIYLIGTPMFPSVALTLANGKVFTIEADSVSDKNIYVDSATLNDQPWDRAWLRHSDIMAGGVLRLQMTDHPGKWPQGSAPPSPLSDPPK